MRRNSWPPSTVFRDWSLDNGIFYQLDDEQGKRILSEFHQKPPEDICKKRRNLIHLHVRNAALKAQNIGSLSLFPTSGRRRAASVFQNYYPEGGWGFIVLFCAFLSVLMVQGVQNSIGLCHLQITLKFRTFDITNVVGKSFGSSLKPL